MEEKLQDKMFTNRQLVSLIIPLFIDQILNATVGIADVVMVATLGEYAVSGVSLVDSINILLFALLNALGTGGAVVASQYLGRKDRKMAENTAVQLIYVMLGVSSFITAVMIIFCRPILSGIFGKVEDSVMDASLRYFWITMLALPGIALYSAVAAIFRAQGNSKLAMYASTIGNAINIGGNAFCIFVLKMGVEGVAIPTTVSRIGGALLLTYWMLREKPYHGETPLSIRKMFRVGVEFSLVKKILKIGIPSGLENSIFQFGKILVLSLISTFGTTAIAANATANSLATIEVLAPSAINIAMLTVIGRCCGAADEKQAMYYTKKLMVIAYVSMFLWNVPYLLSLRGILAFYHLSPETTELAWWITMCHGVFGILFWPMSFTLPNALRAANDAAFPMIVSVISMFAVRIGMSYVFKYTQIFGLIPFMGWTVAYGALGTWIAMALDWVVRSNFFIWRIASGKWKGRKLI
ncbi:MATE family efflux transporter [Treponema sp.]|uniref:MATE family efflux transporter n=1 Tax=Treponema sp. TaxID=166 RepID=UPI002A833D39|nr:MATE family efflux transporter [Treponema sp.]MCI6442662.1 MATE family efflux transporter [Spirochaetia bacterium]MDY4132402.1 MATE family efflux transporter [Treponema sp.]